MADFANSFSRFDNYVDTSDFDLTYLMNLWYGYRDLLPADVRAATEAHFKRFKYWYTDPQPAGVIDQRYYWSENHRLLYHADEYLAGQAFPNDVFSNDGNTGAWHRDRANGFIDKWLTEKARYGFTEWHSDVYYQKTFDALLTFVEWVNDPVLSRRASMVLDLLLFDIALHIQKGNDGATHGRSYMKDKSVADRPGHLQPVEAAVRRHQPRLQLHRRPGRDAHGPGPAATGCPAVILRVAQSKHTTVDQEHMGVALDAAAPVDPTQTGIDGHSFSDPAEVEFWWEKGAQTAWQTVPLTLDTLDAHRLWDSDFFKPFKPIADLTGGDRAVAQNLAQSLQAMLGFALLTAVDTYTYRVRLRDALDRAVVPARRPRASSTTSRRRRSTSRRSCSPPTRRTSRSPARSGPTTTATGPATGACRAPRSTARSRSASTRRSSRTPGPPLTAFRYLDYTHAYFPQERFDEVVQQNGWTFGRKGNGYVALWSWRPMQWRTYTDPGHLHPRAHAAVRPRRAGRRRRRVVHPGGRRHAVRRLRPLPAPRCSQGAISVQPRAAVNGLAGRVRRELRSRPTEGLVQFGTTGALTVQGPAGRRSTPASATTTRGRSSRSGRSSSRSPTRPASLKLDFATTSRTAASTPEHCGNGHEHHGPGHPAATATSATR